MLTITARGGSSISIRKNELPVEQRIAAARLLALSEFDLARPALLAVLTPQSPAELQHVALQSLVGHADEGVATAVIERWPVLSPSLRREVQEALLARSDRTLALLTALEQGKIKTAEIDPARIQQLRKHARADVRKRAEAVFGSTVASSRGAILKQYQSALGLQGDTEQGRLVFQAQCASCHKLQGTGQDVGANLLATLPGKSPEDILVAILDPNREVDTRYLNYQAVLSDGRTLTGVVIAETAAGITLRRADGVEDRIRRDDLESLRSTGQSLMPEGLELQINEQQMANLIAFLREAVKSK